MSIGLDDGFQELLELDRLQVQADPAARDPRHVEEDIDEMRHLPCLALEDGSCCPKLWRETLRVLEQLGRGAERGEGVPQLMRQGRDELVLAAVRLAQEALALPALRDVARDLRCADDGAVVIPDG